MRAESKRAYRSLAKFLDGTGTRQDEFARQLGVSSAYVSMIARGLRRPSLTLALRIAEAANVPIESLIPSGNEKAPAA